MCWDCHALSVALDEANDKLKMMEEALANFIDPPPPPPDAIHPSAFGSAGAFLMDQMAEKWARNLYRELTGHDYVKEMPDE